MSKFDELNQLQKELIDSEIRIENELIEPSAKNITDRLSIEVGSLQWEYLKWKFTPEQFLYKPTPLEEGNLLNISPSSLYTLYENPYEWYESNVNDNKSFNGNDNTMIGTAIHYVMEVITKFLDIDVKSIYKFLTLCDDTEKAIKIFDQCIDTVMEYVIKTRKCSDRCEEQFHQNLTVGNTSYQIGGTIDKVSIEGNRLIVTDYKTSNVKYSSIQPHHRLQLYLYAQIMLHKIWEIDVGNILIEVVYIVKPTKTLPCRIVSYREEIDATLMEKLTQQLHDTIQLVKLVKDGVISKEIAFRENLMHYKINKE